MPATLDLMEALARHVSQESGNSRQELATAATVLQTQTLLALALTSQTARAMPAGRGLMEAHARRAAQASTRMYRELAAAAAVRQTQARLSRAQL
jgi:hypothetical protein